jgi:DeoR family transcriptional regulator, galactitol utilization operon repressor
LLLGYAPQENNLNISLSDREKKILDILTENQNQTVNSLSKIFNVSTVTIRSDLGSLEEKGLIVRMRGGAFPAYHPSILEGQKKMRTEKERIAKAAAAMIEDGDTVMINDGSTSSLIPRYLLGKRDIHIVTNSTLAFTYARINPALNITLVGGEFRPSTEAIVGPMALRDIEEYHVKYAFLGTGGFSIETGLTTHLAEGSEIFKKMTEQAEQVITVTDSSKYGKNGFVKIFPLARMDKIITDTGLNNDIYEKLIEAGLIVKLV